MNLISTKVNPVLLSQEKICQYCDSIIICLFMNIQEVLDDLSQYPHGIDVESKSELSGKMYLITPGGVRQGPIRRQKSHSNLEI